MSGGPPALPSELGRVTGARRVSGGDLNEAWAVELEGGGRAFVKTRTGAPPGEYATEAAGLAWLGEAGAVRVPRVLAAGDDHLALEWIEPGTLGAPGAQELGRGLAALHQAGAPAFGAAWPMHLGPVVLSNEPCGDWPAFYAQRRLLPLAARARDAGAMSAAGVRAVERVAERMSELAGPPEPPARLHGDLWGGNVLAGSDGRPWLIDPAAHGGHREVDLAMLRLFGAPDPRTLAAYAEAHPLAAGHEERVELWQLLPLLVHAVLFGGGYGASAERAARRYG
ncbi:fructosamine kinase family protein [Capillimicrobium parvum]|uniref:Ketoamine kinase n=1 Tax=Capillimicrobium parvum TaxID=2884022 RepID=A0A9E6XZV2_9ACTN|nr:fructosamine kinase family protein [Capillimicrobium parvum]UGS37509.1 putative ketoamine kinase [Capillimicrobium parvum]